ncbi:pentapeptide repeat-containing protein [Sodalis glossinidius]
MLTWLRRNLAHAELIDADLTFVNLVGSNLNGANWSAAI